jgi:hypothetical protein
MLTLTLFVAGHLLVALIATLFIRFLRRQPNLLARRESVFELNSRPMRIEAAQTELARSMAEAEVIDKRIERADVRIADALPLDDPPSTVAAYGLVAGILAEAEAGLVWLLSGPVTFLSLSSQAWGFVAPAFAAAWIILLHVLLGWAITDKHRAARTVRRAKVAAGLCGCTVIIGGWFTLSGRNLTDTALIEQLAGVGLMILAALVSVCSAFCSLVATTLLEAQHHERERGRLLGLRDQYGRHIGLIERDLARLQGPPDSAANRASTAPVLKPADSPSAATAVPAGIIPTALMLICLISIPGWVRAQSVSPKPPVNLISGEALSRASAPAFARINGCEFLADITGSVDRLPLKSTLSQTADMMPMIVDRFNCAVVRVTPFAGDLFVSIDEVVVPSVEDTSAICQRVRPSESARSKALDLLYPVLAPTHQQQAADVCMTKIRPIREGAIAKRRAAIALTAERLRAAGELSPRGPCTALAQVVQRALQRSQHVIAITDGIPTCTPPATATRIPADGTLLFLLVPPSAAHGADRANLLLDRLGALERSFQGARAVLAPEATPSFWQLEGH